MISGRMPACVAKPFEGGNNASVPNVLMGQNANKALKNNQQGLSGNRCGHNKNSFKKPRFHQDSKRRPHAIEEAKRRIERSFSNKFLYPAFGGLFYHPVEKERGARCRRSESIEGTLSLALVSLLQSLNLHKMACGHYDNKNQFMYYNYAYIENLTDQNSSRVKREMKLLQDYGIIKVLTIRSQNHDGSWRTKEVRIDFTDKIFHMLELTDEFLRDRETISIMFHGKQLRLEKNQNKRDIYRKPNFTHSKPIETTKTAPISSDKLTKCVKKLSMIPPKVDKGRGEAIKQLYSQLTYQGVSPADAAKIIRNKYPPPN